MPGDRPTQRGQGPITGDQPDQGTPGRLRRPAPRSPTAPTYPRAGRPLRADPSDRRSQDRASQSRPSQTLDAEIRDLDVLITELVEATVPVLLEQPGIGVHCAAQLLITAGDNPDRLRSEGAFAALCGVSPVAASSSKTDRHRLNLGGDRQANTALWMIAHVRLVHDDRTKAYAAKRTALGDNRKEIMRRLKRYIVREVYPIIIEALVDVETRDLT